MVELTYSSSTAFVAGRLGGRPTAIARSYLFAALLACACAVARNRHAGCACRNGVTVCDAVSATDRGHSHAVSVLAEGESARQLLGRASAALALVHDCYVLAAHQ